VLVGIAGGVLLAVLAIVSDFPMILLVLLSALAGASAVTAGLMVLTGAIETQDFTDEAVTAQAGDDWWWYLVYGVLAVAGIVYQMRAMERVRGSMRESWEAR
jgi:hypothetical protein